MDEWSDHSSIWDEFEKDVRLRALKKKPIGDHEKLFSNVEPRKIPDVLYTQLVSLITNGRLRPGEKLPSERALALELGVSRQSIRETIYRAKAAGLIEVKQGGGTFVISSVRGSLRPPLSILLEDQAGKIYEFLEVRRLIESWCAEKASVTANSVDLKRMNEILRRMEGTKLTTAGWEKADLDFHASVASATHNVIAMHVMDGLKESFHSYFRVKKFTTWPERRDLLLKHHRAIFDAIRRKNSREARKKALQHLDYVEELIKENLGTVKTRKR